MFEIKAEMHLDLQVECSLFLSDFLPKLHWVDKFKWKSSIANVMEICCEADELLRANI
jgi:hypothetical protein